ncbi:putative Ig domain-containing protein [Hydrogenophaga sp. PBL-H3]|uniref:putative Ig domain-containing protein n=1 Tax=Hydrogenophaga sp. PBL-H3 TaxID=434010 RepID=UPI00131F7296|nr:putative Ig domain-containing protein [Hydrogenophaga sp. PBL-H3]QHE75115.1 hypothetical protein F9Z45_03115 [Hydrogenophaga sp. PBL-H3]QHE79542.1 hypothetical protein F9Z44_03115 [Hydrogenophaga sp. PBL-H3]
MSSHHDVRLTHALSTEEAVWLLGSLAGLHRKPFDVELLIKRFAPPWDLPTLIEALAGLGLKAQTVPWPDPAHPPPPFPVVAFARSTGKGSAGPPLLMASRSDGQLGLFRPCEAPSELDDLHTLSHEAQPWLLLCAAQDPTAPAGDEDGATHAEARQGGTASPGRRPGFGFAWFIPELLRHRRLWRDVLLASLAIQLVGLATPLFTQVIIDKVIAHHSVSTLWVLGVALVVFMLFTSTMSWLRQYLVLHTGSRMDAVLGEQVMRHLLRLPLPYFEARPTGTLVARLQGVETLREFVSGAAVTLLLDLPFLFIFLAVMFWYSWVLSLVAVGLLLLIVGVSLLMVPVFRQRLGVTKYASDDGEWLYGTAQSDRLIGGEGDDQLFGNGGHDRLAGGVGSDGYHVDASATPDEPAQTVIAEVWREQDSNVLFIHGDVSGSDLWLALEGDDLVLRMGADGDSVRFVGFDPRVPGMPAPVERIELWNTDEAVQFSDLLALGVYDPQADPADLVVNVGDGAVDIDIGSAAYEAGSVAFGDGIDPGDLQSQLTFEADGRGGHWLVLNYGEPGDVLRLSGFDPEAVLDGGHAIDRFEFANGVVLDYATLVSEGFLVEGNAQADTLRGTNVVDRLFGNDGGDALDGGAGSDELHGGRGQDQLTGGDGDDAYVFHLGDGVDSLIDSGSTDFNFIRFGAGIRPEDIRQAWDGTTLVVHYSDADTVRIVDYRGMDGNPAILALVFDDGQVRSLTEETNRAPELTGSLPNATAMEDAVFQMVLPTDLFRDLDAADELRLTIRRSDGSPLPAWLSFNAERRILSGRPDSDDLGVMQLVVEARDHFGASVSTGFSLNVLSEPTGHENKAPVAVQDTATLRANTTEPATGNVLANDTDPDGETLSLLRPAVQRGILGVIGWQADGAYTYLLNDLLPEVRALAAGQTATDRFVYTVTDGQAQAQGNLLITVQGVNDAPTSQQPLGNRLVIKKETSTWSVPASAFTDPDQGDSLSYSAALAGGAALPAWMVFDAASRSFVAKPPASAKGELSVKVTATDLHGATASQVFQVRVGNPGDKPKGNEGLGNGEDPPPPGHDTDFNDGPGTGPGNPGTSEGRHAQPAVPVEALQTAMNPAPVELVDWAAWDTPQEPATASNAPTSGDVDIEHHWQQLLATLQQLDAQRSANDFWSDPNQSAGFGLTGLAAGDSQVGLSGASAVGLTAGSGTHLTSFSGLKEGLASLA